MTDREFRAAWNDSRCIEEAAESAGCSVQAARNRAAGLRVKGWSLKRLGSASAVNRASTRKAPPDFDPSNFGPDDFDELVGCFSEAYGPTGFDSRLDEALTAEVYRRAAALRQVRVGKVPEDLREPVEICEIETRSLPWLGGR